MKKLYLCLQFLLVLFTIKVHGAPGDFITTWDLSKAGSGITSITFGVAVHATNVTNYSWVSTSPSGSGSGSIPGGSTSVTISGLPAGATDVVLSINSTNFRAIKINNTGDKVCLVNVNQWGTATWSTMSNAFYGCSNLTISATDAPILTGVSTLNNMFRDCSKIATIPNINSWSTSTITDMGAMFRGASLFNSNIGSWATSNVTALDYMFRDAAAFNQDISGWNVSKVTDMRGMAQNATAFNQNLGGWSLAAVTAGNSLTDMFSNSGMDCAHYSATLIGWADNVNTPNSLTLGATGRTYGTNAATAHNTLTTVTGSGGKGWTINGDAAGVSACTLPTFPVTLVSFEGRNTDEGVALRWETTSESGASHFDVERSVNARSFEKIGRVEALGNSSVWHRYAFLDDMKGYGPSVAYYRLRSVDLDESFSISRAIVLRRVEAGHDFTVYPNPVKKSGIVTIEFAAPQSEIRLIDMLGREKVVPVARMVNGKAEVELGSLESGLYIMKLSSGSRRLIVN